MTVLPPAVYRSTRDIYRYSPKSSKRTVAQCDRTPSKAQWVIRNSSYYSYSAVDKKRKSCG